MWRRYGDDLYALLVLVVFSFEALTLGFLTPPSWRCSWSWPSCYGILLSEMAVGIETMLLSRYPRVRDRLMLLAATFVEFLGYHQILAVERLISMFQIRRKRGIWGQMRAPEPARSCARRGWRCAVPVGSEPARL